MSTNSVDGVVGVSASGTVSVPVKWNFPDWRVLALPGNSGRSETFCHDSLPGIFWHISVHSPPPQSILGIFVKFSVGSTKSGATAVTAELSINLASADGKGSPINFRCANRVFTPYQYSCLFFCSAMQCDQLKSYESIVLSGEIIVQLPVSGNGTLQRMYASGSFSDLSISAGYQTFRVHKAVLHEACPALLDLPTSPAGVVCISSTREAVQAMLQHIYGESLSFVFLTDLCCEVLELADKFSLGPLKRLCESALITSINLANVLKLAGLALRTNAVDLKIRVFQFAGNNFDGMILQDDWRALKTNSALMALSFCEGIIEGFSGAAAAQAISSVRAQLASTATAHFEVPVRWEIADFQNLMENSGRSFSITCKEKFSHDSMPGIAWELLLYPNGKPDYVALCMRPILTSNKKSQATAPSGGYSLRFEVANNTNVTATTEATPTTTTASAPPPPEQTLLVKRFSLTSRRGISQFTRKQMIVARCLANDGAAVLVGKILVEPPPCDEVLVSRKRFESASADFTVQVGDEAIAVHKSTLSHASPAMAAMLDMKCKESENNSVDIKETTVEAVRALLQFWYGDPLCFDGLEDLSMDVYKLAHLYQDCKLRQICEDALLGMVARENVVHLAAFAANQSCEALETVAAKFIGQNADVLKSDAWADFKRENIKLALDVAERSISLYRKP